MLAKMIATVEYENMKGEGIECSYFPQGDGTGIKAYYQDAGSGNKSRWAAYRAAKAQEWLHARGVAPKVLEFGVVWVGNTRCWGYRTEAVKQPWFCPMSGSYLPAVWEQYAAKFEKMRSGLGLSCRDLRSANVGVGKFGRMVVLDCGLHTMYGALPELRAGAKTEKEMYRKVIVRPNRVRQKMLWG